MLKYLVIDDPKNGYIEVNNLAIIEAPSEEDARKLFCKHDGIDLRWSNTLQVYELGNLETPWFYYEG